MANVMFKIGMNNTVKPGQQTRDEVIQQLIGQGVPVEAANPVFDPITGELIQVEVHLPDTASQQAQDAINANNGVATATPPIPEPPTSAVIGIDATAGLLEYGAAITWPTSGPGAIILYHSKPTTVVLGAYLAGQLTTSGYASHLSVNPMPLLNSQIGLRISTSGFSVGTMIIPANTIAIKASDGTQYNISHPQLTLAPEASQLDFYVLSNKLYLAFERDNGTIIVPELSLEQALAYPNNPVSSAISI